MGKFFDFTAVDPRVAQANDEYNKPDPELMKAIGHEDTLILAGNVPLNERSRSINEAVEEALRTTGSPDAKIVIAENQLADDPAFLKWSLEYGVFYWEFEEALFGGALPSWMQTIGDCVSFGAGRACNDVIIIDAINNGGETSYIAPVATEPIYAGSRVEIGKGRLSGDGSIGIWAIQWLINYGVLLREKHGSGALDLTTYSGQKARQWGARGNGCPDELEPIAKVHPITGSTPVTNAEQAKIFVIHLNPITIASNRGFAKQRNSDGTCDPVGSWSHQMMIRGVCILKSGKLVFIIQNSWGDYLGSKNNVIETMSGRKVTLPQGAFACDAEILESDILKPGDCNSIAGARGWKATKQQMKVIADAAKTSLPQFKCVC